MNGRVVCDPRNSEKALVWMGPEGCNIAKSECWVEELPEGWYVWVDVTLKTGEVHTVGTEPFSTQLEAEAFWCDLAGQAA
jgi:hypothetical protein